MHRRAQIVVVDKPHDRFGAPLDSEGWADYFAIITGKGGRTKIRVDLLLKPFDSQLVKVDRGAVNLACAMMVLISFHASVGQ